MRGGDGPPIGCFHSLPLPHFPMKKNDDLVDELKIEKKDFSKIKHGIFYEKIRRSGYKINSFVIIVGFLIPVGLLFYNGMMSGFSDKWSVACPLEKDRPCKNPFYECNPLFENCPDEKLKTLVCSSNPGFCMMPMIENGMTFGDKKTFIEENFFLITIGSLSLVYLFNHVLYNSKEERLRRRKEYESHG
jgi:hypothetical protein